MSEKPTDVDDPQRWERYGLPGPAPGETMGMYTPVTKTAERKSFSLKAQLVDDGRSLVPLAETQALWSWVKVYASGGEPLVLLRVGAKSGGGRLAERIGEDGTPLPGGSKKNKFAPPVYREGEYFE